MRRFIPILVVVLNLLVAINLYACPFCKDSVPNSDAQATGGVPSGFNNTVYIMLLTFFCMIGMVTFTLVKGARTSINGTSGRGPRGFPLE